MMVSGCLKSELDAMKILVAVDGSDYTKRVLEYLAAHDVWLAPGHEYSVLHVVPALPLRAAAALDREVVQGYYSDEAQAVFAPVRSFFEEHGIRASYLAEVGRVADVIAHCADAGQYDLLMMGSHGHGALGSLVLGSVASKVLSHCRTPLLLVR
jgi:nucleotide-binding universal stress UspA family protein